ncbi:hypothetical protein M3172_22900 [Mesobacillus subterraneus]|uniref:hypothetical protein n=1 Tax=Mesobacillus subterraneus TaxID=285983 RepID=UPI00203B7E24|nr:hypothetical protein [Mesobacillus subterraneus]MCM3576021.1 hypothetical protein [Mesobacillus subterraneus]
MHIVVDESLGIPVNLVGSATIRNPKLKKAASINDYITSGKGGMFQRSLPLIKRTLQEELDEVGAILAQQRSVLYIYDSFTTDSGVIKRLKNWYFPNEKLYILDGSENKALAVYLILEQANLADAEDIVLTGNYKRLTITNNQKYRKASNYLALNKRKFKQYFLFEHNGEKPIVSGSKQGLLDEIAKHNPANMMVMASRTKLDADYKGSSFYQLEGTGLPIQSDVVDILIADQDVPLYVKKTNGVTSE